MSSKYQTSEIKAFYSEYEKLSSFLAEQIETKEVLAVSLRRANAEKESVMKQLLSGHSVQKELTKVNTRIGATEAEIATVEAQIAYVQDKMAETLRPFFVDAVVSFKAVTKEEQAHINERMAYAKEKAAELLALLADIANEREAVNEEYHDLHVIGDKLGYQESKRVVDYGYRALQVPPNRLTDIACAERYGISTPQIVRAVAYGTK